MQPPPIPARDAERVDVLRSLGILETPADPDFDELTRLAAQTCQVPIALISLIDRDRQWFKSNLGFPRTETPRENAFCAHAIAEPAGTVFTVPDAHDDARFQRNPFVLGDPHIRFYAGAPLVTHDGWVLGTLCVIDRQPRHLSPEQQRVLVSLSRHVVNAIECHRLVESRSQAVTDLELTRRAHGEFLAALTHEIRSPIKTVVGMTSLLRNSPLNAEQRACIDHLQHSGDHLLHLINDVLDFAKLETGRLTLDLGPCDLAKLVQGAVALVATRAREKQLAIAVAFAPGVPAVVEADTARLRQILGNLLSNSVKFTARGSISIQITAPPRTDGRLEISFCVRDTGIGIPPDRLNRLFQPFTPGEAPAAGTPGGVGLGLSISKRLAELHGGRIWVESQPGSGSAFHFTLVTRPIAALAAAEPARPAPPSEFDPTYAQRHPARILVAEDNPVNQKVLAHMLQKLGYAPEIVSDGRAAIAAVLQGNFNLVLMDVEMPGVDGPEATRRIRAEVPTERQPVIVAVTAHALSGSREQLIAAGMDGYLSKPILLDALIRVLSRLGSLRQSAPQ